MPSPLVVNQAVLDYQTELLLLNWQRYYALADQIVTGLALDRFSTLEERLHVVDKLIAINPSLSL